MEKNDKFVLLKILEYLDLKSICHLMRTCRYLNGIKFFLEKTVIGDMNVYQLTKFPNLAELKLCGCYGTADFTNLANLRFLDCSYCEFTIINVEKLTNLTTLNCRICNHILQM